MIDGMGGAITVDVEWNHELKSWQKLLRCWFGRSQGREVFFLYDTEKLKALSGEFYLQTSAWEK
jgi:hypothetical protein